MEGAETTLAAETIESRGSAAAASLPLPLPLMPVPLLMPVLIPVLAKLLLTDRPPCPLMCPNARALLITLLRVSRAAVTRLLADDATAAGTAVVAPLLLLSAELAV